MIQILYCNIEINFTGISDDVIEISDDDVSHVSETQETKDVTNVSETQKTQDS